MVDAPRYATAETEGGWLVYIVATMESVHTWPRGEEGEANAKAYCEHMNAPAKATLTTQERKFLAKVAKEGNPVDDATKGLDGVVPADPFASFLTEPEPETEAAMVARITAAVVAALKGNT